MRAWNYLVAMALALLLFGSAIAQSEDLGARAGFEHIQEIAAGEDLGALAGVMPKKLVEGRLSSAKEVDDWRAEFADRLAGSTIIDVREAGARAVVRFRHPRAEGEYELPLTKTGDEWIVDAQDAYLVKGPRLTTANGMKNPKVRLNMRTTGTQGHGDCFYSFAHATTNPDHCKGRMDVWFCHNGDLHGGGSTRFLPVTARKVGAVKEIPVGADWKQTIPAVSGKVYVAHSRRTGHRDFYATFKVTKVGRTSVTLEWRLLAAGVGSPASIHTVVPLVSNDGADGQDALCAKSDR